jgi:hypothetical protein
MLAHLPAAGVTMGLVYAVIAGDAAPRPDGPDLMQGGRVDREARPNEFLGSETLQQVYLGDAT